MSVQTSENKLEAISPKEIFSILYHDKFDYPLTVDELKRWRLGNYLIINSRKEIERKGNFIFLKGRKEIITKRLLKEKITNNKIRLAKRAVKALARIPTILMLGLTGSLAMGNADSGSDIDLLIITRKGTLWTTRALAYAVLAFYGLKTRRPNDKIQKDKLCLNMWLDESATSWKKRNLFTAHEIAQIKPLLNKNKTYEKFLDKNRWIKGYWPNAIRQVNTTYNIQQREGSAAYVLLCSMFFVVCSIFEPFAFSLQYLYMKPKITREQIHRNRAIFHPVDWSGFVLKHLST